MRTPIPVGVREDGRAVFLARDVAPDLGALLRRAFGALLRFQAPRPTFKHDGGSMRPSHPEPAPEPLDHLPPAVSAAIDEVARTEACTDLEIRRMCAECSSVLRGMRGDPRSVLRAWLKAYRAGRGRLEGAGNFTADLAAWAALGPGGAR